MNLKNGENTVGMIRDIMQKYEKASVVYRAHVADKGWLPEVHDGQTAGTTGEARQMEAVQIRTTGGFCTLEYRVHMAEKGWSPWSRNGETAGTTGEGRRIEAVEIRLA